MYVREHVNVRIAVFKERAKATHNGPFKTGRVTFDAESVGLGHDFHGSVPVGSDAAQLLAEAFRNDEPVTVAIASRRYTPKDGGDPISPLTPIHELRGIVGEATKASADVTNNNCRVPVVAVSGEFTDALVSDPEEWGSPRETREDTLAPDGYAVLSGAVISVASAWAGSVDVRQQIHDDLKTSSSPPPAQRPPTLAPLAHRSVLSTPSRPSHGRTGTPTDGSTTAPTWPPPSERRTRRRTR